MVVSQGHSAVRLAGHRQHSQILSVLSAGHNQGIIDLDRLGQGRMGVTGDNDVDALHRLGQLVIFPFALAIRA